MDDVAIVVDGQVPFTEYKAYNAGTVYQLAVIDHGELGIWLMFSTGWGGLNYGEWVHITHKEIAWSYLAEKVPDFRKHEGDKPGWVKVLKAAGVEVFN